MRFFHEKLRERRFSIETAAFPSEHSRWKPIKIALTPISGHALKAHFPTAHFPTEKQEFQ